MQNSFNVDIHIINGNYLVRIYMSFVKIGHSKTIKGGLNGFMESNYNCFNFYTFT